MIANLSDKLRYYALLDERQRRLFLAIEAKTIGWHGVKEVSEAFEVHPNTIRAGKKELPDIVKKETNTVRQTGGGRKKI